MSFIFKSLNLKTDFTLPNNFNRTMKFSRDISSVKCLYWTAISRTIKSPWWWWPRLSSKRWFNTDTWDGW